MWFHNDNKKRKCFSFFLAMLLLLQMPGGCGKNLDESVPELKEPLLETSFYRPAKTGTLDDGQYYYGTVLPKEYSCFVSASATLRELFVHCGEEVKKGDLIAALDTGDLNEKIQDLNMQLSEEAEIQKAIEKQNDLKARLADDTVLSIKKEREEQRYQKEQYEQERKQKLAALKQYEELVEDSYLYAEHSGTVAYVCSLEESNLVESGTVIAVILSDSEKVIKIDDLTIDDATYKNAVYAQIKRNGKCIPVKAVQYPNEALSYMENVGYYPNAMYEVPEGCNASLGDQMLLSLSQTSQKESILIGKDSLIEEGNKTYCYVKTEEGDEKREISIGKDDSFYVEVTKGIQEGELVSYHNTSLIPGSKNYQEAAFKTYKSVVESNVSDYKTQEEYCVKAEANGTIFRVYVKEGDRVKKGDPLYSVTQVGKKSALLSIKDQMEEENISYKEQMYEWSKQQMELETKNTDTDLRLQEEYLAAQKEVTKKQHHYQIEQLKLEYARTQKENDGSDERKILSPYDGTVTAVSIRKEDTVKEEQKTVTIAYPVSPLLHTSFSLGSVTENKNTNLPSFGSVVYFKIKDRTEKGICVVNHLESEGYMERKKDQICFSEKKQNDSSQREIYVTSSYVTKHLEKGKLAEPTRVWGYGYNVKGVMVLPSSYIRREEQKESGETIYYVYKYREGKAVKEYIRIDDSMLSSKKVIVFSGVEQGDKILTRG